MAKCQACGDDVDEIQKLKVGKRTLKLCESCADEKREQLELGEAAEGVLKDMMEWKGR